MSEVRSLPGAILTAAIGQGLLREGPQGSMWAAHEDEAGWEERGADWRGFSGGGTKALFRFGDRAGCRVCVTEAAIDAMSLATIEDLRAGTLYVSTGGGWSPVTAAALRGLAVRHGTVLVAATDADAAGETFSNRLCDLAAEAGCEFTRLPPREGRDWNAVLQHAAGLAPL